MNQLQSRRNSRRVSRPVHNHRVSRLRSRALSQPVLSRRVSRPVHSHPISRPPVLLSSIVRRVTLLFRRHHALVFHVLISSHSIWFSLRCWNFQQRHQQQQFLHVYAHQSPVFDDTVLPACADGYFTTSAASSSCAGGSMLLICS